MRASRYAALIERCVSHAAVDGALPYGLQRDIAETLGCNQRTVTTVCRRLGLRADTRATKAAYRARSRAERQRQEGQ